MVDVVLGIYPHPVAYGLCKSCGSLSQFPPLDPQELGTAYSESYWVEGEGDSTLKQLALWYQLKILSLDQGRFLRHAAGGLKGKRILEIGPGRGDFLLWAKAQGAAVMGWERSSRAVNLLKSHGLAAESVVLEDLSHWPQSGQFWDVIAGFHVLEHLVEPAKVVAGLLSRLAPQGLLIFQVPRIDSWQARILGKRWIGLDAPRHVSIPTLSGLRRLAFNLDLEECATKHFSLRDNALFLLTSLFHFLTPHRPDFSGFRLAGLLVGAWGLQPLALLEAFMGKGATIMVAFQRKRSSQS